MIFAKTIIQSRTSALQFHFYTAVGSLELADLCHERTIYHSLPCAFTLRQEGYINGSKGLTSVGRPLVLDCEVLKDCGLTASSEQPSSFNIL
jgi:hypothetical protein